MVIAAHIHTKATWQTCCHCALLAMTVTAAPYVTYAQVVPAVLSLVSARFWLVLATLNGALKSKSHGICGILLSTFLKMMGDKFGAWKRRNRKLYTSILAVSSEHHGITNAAQVIWISWIQFWQGAVTFDSTSHHSNKWKSDLRSLTLPKSNSCTGQ